MLVIVEIFSALSVLLNNVLAFKRCKVSRSAAKPVKRQ